LKKALRSVEQRKKQSQVRYCFGEAIRFAILLIFDKANQLKSNLEEQGQPRISERQRLVLRLP
jgi:hypothetical protein